GPVRVVFLNNREIAVSFPVANPTFGLTTRSEGRGGAYLFKTAFIDVETGAAHGERRWATFEALSAIIPLNSRGFLVRHATQLYLYSFDLTLIATKELPPGWVMVQPSITGQRLYMVYLKRIGTEVEVLDAESLRTLGKFDIPHLHYWHPAA